MVSGLAFRTDRDLVKSCLLAFFALFIYIQIPMGGNMAYYWIDPLRTFKKIFFKTCSGVTAKISIGDNWITLYLRYLCLK